MMQVKINGKPQTFDGERTIKQVLEELNLPLHQGIAVALNYSVISREKLAETRLQDGDKLEIIHATAGG